MECENPEINKVGIIGQRDAVVFPKIAAKSCESFIMSEDGWRVSFKKPNIIVCNLPLQHFLAVFNYHAV